MFNEDLSLLVLTSVEDVKGLGDELRSLVREALGVDQPIECTLREINLINGGSMIVAAIIGGELAAMNAFIRHRFLAGDQEFFAFQSGFSATSNQFRGQGLWPKLLRASEEILRDAGGRWIFGFPNKISHPLFERKLSYRSIPMLSRRLSLLDLQILPAFDCNARYVCPDIEALTSWKISCNRADITQVNDESKSVLLKKKKRFGISLADIGGWIAPGAPLNRLCKDVARETRSAFIRIEVNEGSQYVDVLNLKEVSRPLVVKTLCGDFPNEIDLFGGLSDNF